jgi:TRAP-type C4-dicarboxylate transport system permease small subunit
MRRLLDTLYAGALGVACLSMVLIALMVMAQILGRLIDRGLILAGATPLGLSIPSLSDFGGFLFVSGATLALPATLRAAGHVRVTLVAGLAGARAGRALDGLALAAALLLAGFATWHLGAQAWDSFRVNAVSFGMVRIPLWIPQGVMTLGFALLVVALADELAAVLAGRDPAFRIAERTRSEGGH